MFIFNPWNYVEKNKNLRRSKKNPDTHSTHIFARALLSDRKNNITNILSQINRKFDIDFTEENLVLPFPFVSSFNNQRILNQKGCFTIHGCSDEDLETQVKDFKEKYLIRLIISNKEQIHKELRMLFINEYSLYPDFEGMANQIKEDKSLYKVYFKN